MVEWVLALTLLLGSSPLAHVREVKNPFLVQTDRPRTAVVNSPDIRATSSDQRDARLAEPTNSGELLLRQRGQQRIQPYGVWFLQLWQTVEGEGKDFVGVGGRQEFPLSVDRNRRGVLPR